MIGKLPRHTVLILCLGGLNFAVLPPVVHAEWYLAGQVGAMIPASFRNVDGNGAAQNGSLPSQIGVDNALVYGGKVGYFLPASWRWLGLEVDTYHTSTHLEQKAFTVNGTSLVEGLQVDVTTVALRVLVRNPGAEPGEGFQPYFGLGPALFFAQAAGAGSGSDQHLGFSAAAGTRYFVTKQIALFGEYKLDIVRFDFQNALTPGAGLNGDWQAHNFVAGVSFHFGGP
jgi:opacity protein-like surface antigen